MSDVTVDRQDLEDVLEALRTLDALEWRDELVCYVLEDHKAGGALGEHTSRARRELERALR